MIAIMKHLSTLEMKTQTDDRQYFLGLAILYTSKFKNSRLDIHAFLGGNFRYVVHLSKNRVLGTVRMERLQRSVGNHQDFI
jgi:hypothetical protein